MLPKHFSLRLKTCALFVPLGLAVIAVGSAVAQIGGPSEYPVNIVTAGEQGYPDIATRGSGYLVVWDSDGQDGDQTGVYARRLNSLGTPLGTEFRVNTFTSGGQDTASIGSDSAGNSVVVWESAGQDGDDNGIYGQRFDVDGFKVGTEFRLNATTAGSQDDPEVAVDFTGDFVAVWESDFKDGDSVAVVAQRYSSTGSKLGGEIVVNTFTTGAQVDPDVATDASGNFYVTWSTQAQDGSGAGVFGQRFNSSGIKQGTEFQVNTYTTDAQDEPAIAADSAGNVVIAWESNLQDGSANGVYAQRYNNVGAKVGTEFRANTHTPLQQDDVAVGFDGTGGFTLAWESVAQDGGLSNGVFGRTYSSGGIPVAPEYQLHKETSDNQDDVAIALDDLGNFVVAWNSYGQDGSMGGIFVRHFSVTVVTTTTTTTTTLPPICSPIPESGCRLSQPGKSQVQLKSRGGLKDSLKWKFSRGDATDLVDFANPTANTSGLHRFCLYDSSASPQPLMEADIPPAGVCNGKPCWKSSGTSGFKYKDKFGVPNGVTQVKYKAGVAGKTQVQVKGKGANLVIPSIPLTFPVTAQMIVDDGVSSTCFQVDYSLPSKNDTLQVKSKGP